MLIFDKITKKYSQDETAVSELSFHVKKGETLVLLGQSGCGKTTALRLVNRLIEPTSGIISLNGENIAFLDPVDLRRGIGYAIQHIGLFLHMTVKENIGIVPKLLEWPEEKIDKRVNELLSIVGLEPKEYREVYPGKLSGGQRQRIGVARALAADPPIILMDEPFGALDPLMREQLQNVFLEIQSQIHKTVLFVTHDMSEAVKMGDRIAILDKGKLLQIATPQELIQNPANELINQFFGKDRLQLLLQINTLRFFRKHLHAIEEQGQPKLSLQSSLMEALKTLKLTNADHLSIYDDNEYLGRLDRKQLLEGLIDSL